MRRTTHDAEKRCAQLGYEAWEVLQRRRKWRIAGRMARAADERWGKKLLSWMPWFRRLPWRSTGRPRMRWEDDLVQCAGTDWAETACDNALWSTLEEGYVQMLL